MLNLLIKDFKLLLFAGHTSLKKKIASLFFTIIFLGCFIGLETVLFVMIINKVKIYSGATTTILTLFLFVISIAMIFLNLMNALKLFFNEKDIEQLTRYPVTNGQIIASKMFFLFLSHYASSVMLVYPIFIAYAQLVGRTPIFYYLVIFYPVLSFLFEGGVALLILYPFKLGLDYLKKHLLVQFIISIALMVVASLLYSKVLSIFMELVVNNSITTLFTTESLANLKNIVNYFVPITFLTEIFLGTGSQILPYLCISVAVFMIGTGLSIVAFNYFRTLRISEKKKDKTKDLKVSKINKTLIKKELILLFKDSNNIFSFSGLLIIQPYLLYLVVDALNDVFTSGTFSYYIAMFPNFIPLFDTLLIMLFTLIINSGANNYISVEKKTVRIMKMMPVSFFKQTVIKVAVPFIASIISLVISTIVLLATGILTFETFALATVLTIILLFVFELVSLREELTVKFNQGRSTFLSSLYSYMLPLTFFVVALLASYYQIDIATSYLFGLIVVVLLGLPFVIRLKWKIINRFLDLEIVN